MPTITKAELEKQVVDLKKRLSEIADTVFDPDGYDSDIIEALKEDLSDFQKTITVTLVVDVKWAGSNYPTTNQVENWFDGHKYCMADDICSLADGDGDSLTFVSAVIHTS